MHLITPRLILRPWLADDAAEFARINADPRVMNYMPAPLTRQESDAFVERIVQHHATHGFGQMAVERRDTGTFIGYVGLAVPSFEASFTPCVEIAWRIAAEHWNQGFATEAAERVLRYGFEEKGLAEVLSFTVPHNTPSRRVMEKIGMQREMAGDFDHPRLPEGHPLQRHVLYRIGNTGVAARG